MKPLQAFQCGFPFAGLLIQQDLRTRVTVFISAQHLNGNWASDMPGRFCACRHSKNRTRQIENCLIKKGFAL